MLAQQHHLCREAMCDWHECDREVAGQVVRMPVLVVHRFRIEVKAGSRSGGAANTVCHEYGGGHTYHAHKRSPHPLGLAESKCSDGTAHGFKLPTNWGPSSGPSDMCLHSRSPDPQNAAIKPMWAVQVACPMPTEDLVILHGNPYVSAIHYDHVPGFSMVPDTQSSFLPPEWYVSESGAHVWAPALIFEHNATMEVSGTHPEVQSRGEHPRGRF